MANFVLFIYSIQSLFLITGCLSTLSLKRVNEHPMKRRSTPFEEVVDEPYSYTTHLHILKMLALPQFNAELKLQELSDMIQPDDNGYSRFNEVCIALGIALVDASEDPNFIDRAAMDKFRFCELCEDRRTRWMTECSDRCCILGSKSAYSDGCPDKIIASLRESC